MNNSKCTDRPGVSHSGISDQCSRGEAGRQSSFQSKSTQNLPACKAGAIGSHRSPGTLLRFFCLAAVAAVLLLSTPFPALCQLTPAIKEGLDYHKAGKLREAIDVYSEVIEKDPKSAEAYNWRGMCYDDLGESDKALADFNKAIEISPNYADAYNNRGEVYRKQGKLAEATSEYGKAASAEKTFAEPHYNMAVVAEAQKRNDVALREYEAYLRLKPEAPDKQRVAQKIEELKKLIAAAPPAPAPGAKPAQPGAAPAPPKPAPSTAAPATPQQPGQVAQKPPEAKPGEKPAAPKPGPPAPGVALPKPPAAPPGMAPQIPGMPPIPPEQMKQLQELGITPEMIQQYQLYGQIANFVSLAFWLFMAVMLFLIGRKTNTSLAWLAFIPLVQIIQMVRIARKPLWWLALLIVAPIVGLALAFASPFDPTGGILFGILALILAVVVPVIISLLICTGMASERGKSAIWGVLAWIPCTSPIGFGYLGLSR